MTFESLDCTTPDDIANGIRRRFVIGETGDVMEHVTMGSAEVLRLEPETTSEMSLPERWR